MPKNPGTETDDRSTQRMRTQARVTVNLTARSTRALDQTVEVTGDTQTDVINRAIQVYAHLEAALSRGEQIVLEDPSTQTRERLQFF